LYTTVNSVVADFKVFRRQKFHSYNVPSTSALLLEHFHIQQNKNCYMTNWSMLLNFDLCPT